MHSLRSRMVSGVAAATNVFTSRTKALFSDTNAAFRSIPTNGPLKTAPAGYGKGIAAAAAAAAAARAVEGEGVRAVDAAAYHGGVAPCAGDGAAASAAGTGCAKRSAVPAATTVRGEVLTF